VTQTIAGCLNERSLGYENKRCRRGNQNVPTKLTHISMEKWRWIPRDKLSTERVSVSTKIQQRSPRIPLEYISGRAERNWFKPVLRRGPILPP
jgi:hypothetical protein